MKPLSYSHWWQSLIDLIQKKNLLFLYSFRPTWVLFASSVLGQCEMSTKPLPPTYTWLILFPRGAKEKEKIKKKKFKAGIPYRNKLLSLQSGPPVPRRVSSQQCMCDLPSCHQCAPGSAWPEPFPSSSCISRSPNILTESTQENLNQCAKCLKFCLLFSS